MSIPNPFKYTEKKLAKELTELIKQENPNLEITYDREDRSITYGESKITLGNLFTINKNKKKKERLEYLETFLNTFITREPLNYETHAGCICPRIKSRFEISLRKLIKTGLTNGHDDSLTKDLNSEFVIELGVDEESAILVIAQEQLKELGIEFDKAFDLAVENLRSISEDVFEELSPGLYQSKCNDDHDAARIILIGQIELLELKGKPVAFIPTANKLYITGSEDFENLAKCVELSSQAQEVARPLTLAPLVLENEQWIPFHPENIPEYLPVRNLICESMASDYAEQKKQLEKVTEKEELDVFVASVFLFENEETGVYSTHSTLTETVPTYLPKTDLVALNVFPEGTEKPEVVGIVAWEQFYSIMGEKIIHLDLFPPRYYVERFPNDEELSLLLENTSL